jgi:hypothetical protein
VSRACCIDFAATGADRPADPLRVLRRSRRADSKVGRRRDGRGVAFARSSSEIRDAGAATTVRSPDRDRRPPARHVRMNNKTLVAIVLLLGGAALIYFGLRAGNSFTSEFSKFFQGAPSDKSIWLVIAGGLVVIVGMSQLSRRRTT